MSDERRMPFLEHLGELRDRLRNSVLAIVAAAVICYIYRFPIFKVLVRPLVGAMATAKAMGIEGQLVFINPMEGFMVLLKTALLGAVFLASPMVFAQLWGFISPGLYPHEKRWAVPFVLTAILLFVGGAVFCYLFVLPIGYEYFLTAAQGASVEIQKQLGDGSIASLAPKPMIGMDEYFSLTLMLLLVFGAVFELPLVLSVLAMMGVVSAGSLWRFNRYAILIFAIAGALLTPGDLVIGQIAMTGSLTVLYNLSIGFAWLVQRKRDEVQGDEEQIASDQA